MNIIEIYLNKLASAEELYKEISDKLGDSAVSDRETLKRSIDYRKVPVEYRLYISDENIFNTAVDEILDIFRTCTEEKKDSTVEFITDEFLNLLDESERLTQKSKPRSLIHRDGDLHAVVHVWIIRRKDMGIYVLLQKRSESKLINPGCYDVSVAGHIVQGTEPGKTAVREAYEELGLTIKREKLSFIGVHRNSCLCDAVKDNELAAVYVYSENIDADSLVISEDEVSEVCWAEIDEILAAIDNDEFLNCISLEELAMIKKAIF